MEETDEFEGGTRRDAGDVILVAQDAYEGPLHLLLDLVRTKKVDINAISILQVIDSFFSWMAQAKAMRLELAADWLVMMAALTLIKSALLLPAAKGGAADKALILVEDLALRLRRTEAMRSVAEDLARRPRLGVDWFAAGAEPEPEGAAKRLEANLHNLLVAYHREARHTVGQPPPPIRSPFRVVTVEDAIAHLRALGLPDDLARPILELLPALMDPEPMQARSRIASTYVAGLEMAKRGEVWVEQSGEHLVTFRGRREAA